MPDVEEEDNGSKISGNDANHSGNVTLSCSVEETNKLRLQLGLKPLTDAEPSKILLASEQPEEKLSTAELRLKLADSKAKRARQQLLQAGENFGASLLEDDENSLDPLAWVAQSRKLQQTKLYEKSLRKTETTKHSSEDDEDDNISHLHVAHRLKSMKIKSGENLILTLQDKRIIDEEGELNECDDILENEALSAIAKREKQINERRYNPVFNNEKDTYDEVQEGLMNPSVFKPTSKPDILAHYDRWAVEAKMVKKPKDYDITKHLTLGQITRLHTTDPLPKEDHSISLTSTTGIQSDFLTREEAQELELKSKELFKRTKKNKLSKAIASKRHIQLDDDNLSLGSLLNNKSKTSIGTHTTPIPPIEDDDIDDTFLYEQLAKRRRQHDVEKSSSTVSDSKESSVSTIANLVSLVNVSEASLQSKSHLTSMIKTQDDPFISIEQMDDNPSLGLRFSDITEFCRALETPLEKLESSRIVRVSDTRPPRRGLPVELSKKASLKWNQNETPVDPDGTESLETNLEINEEDIGDLSDGDDITDEEKKVVENILSDNLLDGGLISALDYLKSKGELTDDAWRLGRKNRGNAPLHISTNSDDVKLEYKDEYGRIMTPKEAFRYISWVFHGKGPGKKKREKMLRKMELEKKMKSLASNQQQLPTMRALQKQQKTGQSYVVLTSLSK